MEKYKVSIDAKSVVLENGLELTYCELGEENEEIIISGAFYFHTFTPVLEELAKKYHVYGVVMRMSEDSSDTEFNADESINWSRQWGKDIYKFAEIMGINKFHYVGKCHGTNPGWYLFKEHPEMLQTFTSFYMVPHLCERSSNLWTEIAEKEGQAALLSQSIRHQERIPLKIAEVKTLGEGAQGGPEAGGGSKTVGMYGESPQLIWNSLEACEEDLKQTKIPVLLVFGTEDILFKDHFESNIKAMQTIRKAKSVLLQGERHLMEMDCPDRMANEVFDFINEIKKKY